MTWSLEFALNPDRVARLTELYEQDPANRWDGRTAPGIGLHTRPRLVLASAQFSGEPGREREAARAWAFEMKVYFRRGTGEQPVVSYENGVYTVTGLIQTTHPGDHPGPDGIVLFTLGAGTP